MRTHWLGLVCLFAVGCTHTWKPNVYELTQDRIPPVHATEPVAVVNAQTRAGQELLFGFGVHKWQGDHVEITQAYANQLADSLQKAGVRVANGPAPKRLDVSVNNITAWQAFFHYKGKAMLSVTTGDGERFDIVAINGSPGNIYRTLNGTIAIAVLETLKHPGVLAYLARGGGAPAAVSTR